jgi:hypothetical protein
VRDEQAICKIGDDSSGLFRADARWMIATTTETITATSGAN